MVCEKCQKKLGKVITPDPWKDGARNTTEGGGRRVNENKLLTQKKNRSSVSAGSASLLFTRRVHIIAKGVLTRKESVPCVERRCWTLRVIGSQQLKESSDTDAESGVEL
ncbi:uncharacterized protein LOC144913042 isoform X1 [Branchiostoma floridae x Branchiostoma belcheri]|nr:hypothetical protein Bbelb_346160 [Branchiostoma belcheri]